MYIYIKSKKFEIILLSQYKADHLQRLSLDSSTHYIENS